LKYIFELHIASNHITTYLSETQECQLNLSEIYSNMNMSNQHSNIYLLCK